MRTLVLEGFGRQIALFLLVAVALGGVCATILSFGVERYFHGAVSDIAGAPGAYDLIVHLRQDAGDEALRVLSERLTNLSPDIEWQRTTDLGGYINVLVALPQSQLNQHFIHALDNQLGDVPAYAGSTWVMSPSITIRDVHPGLKETLLAIVQSRPEVTLAFERGDTIWAVLRSSQDVSTVENDLKGHVTRLRVAELFPLDHTQDEIDLSQFKDQARHALAKHLPSFVIRDLDQPTSRDDQISALQTVRAFLAQIVSDDGHHMIGAINEPTWWQMLLGIIHDFLERIGLRGVAQRLAGDSASTGAHVIEWMNPETSSHLIEAIDILLSQTPVERGPIRFLLQGDGDISTETMDEIADTMDPAVGWLVRDGGIVEPDPRTTLMMLIENARQIVVMVFATLLTAVLFFFDVATLVSFCRRMDQDAGRSPLNIACRSALHAGIWCMVLMVGIAWVGGAVGGRLPAWALMMGGFLLGVALSFLAPRISPIDEDQYVGAISLGVAEVIILEEVVLPAARPGLFYWWRRASRRMPPTLWMVPRAEAAGR